MKSIVMGTLVVLLTVPTVGCGDDDGDRASDSGTTFGDPSDAGAPETDEEKVARLAETWWTSVDEGLVVYCECEAAGGGTTYETCVADPMLQGDTPEFRMCSEGVMAQHASSSIIAYLECAIEREQKQSQCSQSDLCSDGGTGNDTIMQCRTDALAGDCESNFLTEAFTDDRTEQCG